MDPTTSAPSSSNAFKKETWRTTLLLSFQSIGIVYGRMSIAPSYVTWNIPRDGSHKERVYAFFSFIFWTITIIPLLKYAFIVLRADDNGEGGPFALYSLLCRHAKMGLLPNDGGDNEVLDYDMVAPSKGKRSRARRAIENYRSSHYLMLLLALFGSCVMIGDGILTPAISVFSASSSFERLFEHHFSNGTLEQEVDPFSQALGVSKADHFSESLRKYVPVPCACVVLVSLFVLQRRGTQQIGIVFAPIIIIWLLFISGVGLYNVIMHDSEIIYAINPVYMYKFVSSMNHKSLRSLGNILLCGAGTEAMFADLGHLSKKSIKLTFVCFIYPALILCYAGHAAYMSQYLMIIQDDNMKHHSESTPHHLRHVYVVLSLLASAVGSQSTITATFSIIKQCLSLGCFPRVKVIHTSDKIHGQVYIPDMNWIMMVLSLAVTIGFHDVENIASASGFAIIFGMLVTTCFMSLIIHLYWEKNLLLSACFLAFFGSIETFYLSVCILNFHNGAWFLFGLLVIFMTIMLSWHYGTMKKYTFDVENKVPTDWLTELSPGLGVSRVPGIGFVYSDVISGIPAFFSHFISNLPAFHQVLILVSFKSSPIAHIPPGQRYLVGRVGPRDYHIYRCIVRYGYCDNIRDTDDFEDQIIRCIGEFISLEEVDSEDSTPREMIIVGTRISQVNDLSLPLLTESSRKKNVRFLLPKESPLMRVSVRDELQELVDASESGAAYFVGQPHLSVRNRNNFLKRFLIATYVILDQNSCESRFALNIPNVALVEVGMSYII